MFANRCHVSWSIGLTVILLLSSGLRAQPAEKRPNILFIFTDDKYYNPAVEGRNHRENL